MSQYKLVFEIINNLQIAWKENHDFIVYFCSICCALAYACTLYCALTRNLCLFQSVLCTTCYYGNASSSAADGGLPTVGEIKSGNPGVCVCV